ncbi:MAG: gliding motility-associated C-terminal domain-containing protein [bacterium]|nr:gliding motility-associated C-terminal domain-containing protein [bacterium]
MKIVILVSFLFESDLLLSQSTNNNCASASPYCTGQTMTFPATTGVSGSQPGPFYGCLGSQPNPAWFFLQIASGGSLSISMSANNDIDFICWGPFASLSTACGSLTSSNVQSCSYSPSNTETCTIANAIPGMFYMMLITNFSNSSQTITFSQTSGNASTNCGFVCLITPTNSGMTCAGGAVTISLTPATSSAVSSYTWSGPNSFSSTSSFNVLSALLSSGIYTVRGTATSTIGLVPYSSTCQAVTSVTVIPYPTFSVTPTTASICQGGSVFASVTFTPPSNPSLYFYSWTPTLGQGMIWSPQAQSTLLQPPLAPVSLTLSTLVYNITVQPSFTNISCPVTKSIIITINNPATPSLTMPPPLCDINNPLQLMASPGGGTWSANPAVAPGGMFSPNIAAIGPNTVSYGVSVGTCIVNNTATLQVSKFHTSALSSGITQRCVQDPAFRLMNIVQDSLTGSWFGPNVTSNYFNPAGLATGIYNLTYSTVSSNTSYSIVSQPNPNTCPSSTILAVSVFNPPVPIINPISPSCNNSATVILSATPPGGFWNGNAGISPSGIQTPSLNLIGTNTLTYTAGQGTCVASSSKTFHVSQFNTATLTGPVPNLCANSNPFNLMSIVQNTNGSWSGLGVTNSSAFNPSGLPSSNYVITYFNPSTPNAGLCNDTRTISASVLNPPTPNIVLAGPFCSTKAGVQMTVSPATGSWIPTPYLNTAGVFNPSLAVIGNNAVQYIIGTNTCNARQTMFVSVEAFVPATILAGTGDLCNNSPAVNLSPFTANTLGTWSGPGLTGSSFNPAVTNAGLFSLIYKTATSPSGLCPDVDTLAIRVFSLAVPVITAVGPLCDTHAPFKLQVSPVGGLFGGTNNGAVNIEGLFQPALGIIGNNLVSYSISSGPCIAYAQSMIAVEKFVTADFEKQVDPAYCKNHLAFDLNSLVKNPGGFWSGPGVVGSMFNPAKANIGDNNVIVYQTHSNPTALLCPDSSAVRIRVKDIPKGTAISNAISGCVPFSVLLSSAGFVSGKGSWNIDDGSAPLPGLTNAYVFTKPGSYQVVFNFWDDEAVGCSTQVVLKNLITILPVPKADFITNPSDISISAPDVALTNLTKPLGDNNYVWTVWGMNQLFEVHPKITFPEPGTYKISLRATNINGCSDELIKYVEVKNDFNIFIPNSFTPNFDGLNDYFLPVFSPFGLDPNSYLMEVYDRWGHLVFSGKDHTKGWDGTFQNKGAEELKEDSYTYRIKFRDLEGKVYSKTGTVILLK